MIAVHAENAPDEPRLVIVVDRVRNPRQSLEADAADTSLRA
jgi:hypothetical protein